MLRWLVVLVATVQWLIVPSLASDELAYFGRKSMWVPLDSYLSMTVPAVLAFAAGLFAHGNDREHLEQRAALNAIPQFIRRYPDLPVLLIALSVAGSVGAYTLPSFLAFVAYLVSNLKYAAVILLLFSKQPDRFLWVGGILGFMIVEAASSSLFHDAILWSVLIGGAYVYRTKMSVPLKFGLAVLFIGIITVINSVKIDYRDEFWSEGKESSAVVYFDMTMAKVDSLLTGDLDFSKVRDTMIARLNQGRIISRIMFQVPSKQAFLEGETIREGIVAALVPRFIMPDKAIAGGQKTFQELTGWQLLSNTSMGPSILGEAYGNFGKLGAIAFMGLFGYGLCAALAFVRGYSKSNPLALALIPCIFIHVIKAETDFVTVANFLVKSSVLYFAIFVLLTRVLRYRAIRPGASPSQSRHNGSLDIG